jgi:phytoene synthase
VALRLVPSARRPALDLWLRSWHELSRIPLSVQDPGVAETKLAWWRQEIAEAAQGRARHPLTREWLTLVATESPPRPMPWECWQAQIDGLVQLTHQTRWIDDASLQRHALQTTGNACVVAAHLLGVHHGTALDAARQLGQGLRQSHALARLGQDARAGWVMVGIDWLQDHGVRAHQLSRPEKPMPKGWDGLLMSLHQRTRATLESALVAMRALPAEDRRALTPLRYLGHHALDQADAVRAAGEVVLHQRIVLTPLRKAWTAQRVRWSWLR